MFLHLSVSHSVHSGHRSGLYASYRNAYLLLFFFSWYLSVFASAELRKLLTLFSSIVVKPQLTNTVAEDLADITIEEDKDKGVLDEFLKSDDLDAPSNTEKGTFFNTRNRYLRYKPVNQSLFLTQMSSSRVVM